MARLILRRSSEYVNGIREYKVIIDGEKAGAIKNGKTLELNIEPGIHTIKATIDWCGSREITFSVTDDNDTQYFMLSAFYKSRILFPAVAAANFISLMLNNKVPDYITILVPAATLLGMLYLFTIGRNKYLTLKSVSDTDFMQQ